MHAVVAVAAMLAAVAVADPDPDHPAKLYVVDMETPPQERWKPLVTELKPHIQITLDYLINTLNSNPTVLGVADALRQGDGRWLAVLLGFQWTRFV